MKKNNTETEADGSSSDHSCFVALVTASNLHKDALVLILKLFLHNVVFSHSANQKMLTLYCILCFNQCTLLQTLTSMWLLKFIFTFDLVHFVVYTEVKPNFISLLFGLV